MPLFTFVCKDCETSSEVLVHNGKAAACPSCGSKKMAKQLSHFAAVSSSAGADMPAACDMGNMCCGGGCGFSPN